MTRRSIDELLALGAACGDVIRATRELERLSGAVPSCADDIRTLRAIASRTVERVREEAISMREEATK